MLFDILTFLNFCLPACALSALMTYINHGHNLISKAFSSPHSDHEEEIDITDICVEAQHMLYRFWVCMMTVMLLAYYLIPQINAALILFNVVLGTVCIYIFSDLYWFSYEDGPFYGYESNKRFMIQKKDLRLLKFSSLDDCLQAYWSVLSQAGFLGVTIGMILAGAVYTLCQVGLKDNI